MYHPLGLYCSFDDCSVCLKEDIIKGSCVLSSFSMLSFDPVTNVDEYSTITLRGILIDYPLHMMITALHTSFPLDETVSFVDDKVKITCMEDKKRERRDTTQQYIDGQIQPAVDNLTVFSTLMNLLYKMLLSKPLTDMSRFVQEIIWRNDVVGLVNRDTILYWPDTRQEFEFLLWKNATLYPPIQVGNDTYYLNPFTEIFMLLHLLCLRGYMFLFVFRVKWPYLRQRAFLV